MSVLLNLIPKAILLLETKLLERNSRWEKEYPKWRVVMVGQKSAFAHWDRKLRAAARGVGNS